MRLPAVFRRMVSSPGALLIHLSILFVIAGGLCTWATAQRGSMRLLPGQTSRNMVMEDNTEIEIPFKVTLDSLVIDYYPGMVAPRDYRSHLVIDDKRYVVSMNNIAKVNGYRFYQMSYDSAGATVIIVYHDRVGITLVYIGFAMFAIGGIWMLVSRKGLLRHYLRMAAMIVLLFTCQRSAAAPGIPREQGDSLMSRQVVYSGRVVPFNTVAREFATKLTGVAAPGHLSAEQFIVSMMLYPDEWIDEKVIFVKDRALRDSLGIDGKYISLADLFDSDGYRLKKLFGGTSKGFDRAVLELDEKIELVMRLRDGSLFSSLTDETLRRSDFMIGMELLYNRLSVNRWLFMIVLTVALIGALGIRYHGAYVVSVAVAVVASVIAIVNYLMRWVICGHIPLADGTEVMQFLTVVFLLMSFLFVKKMKPLFPVALLMAGCTALVVRIGDANPTVTPLMPVLSSPWLSLHVSVVMASYALLSLTFPVAVAICVNRRVRESSKVYGVLMALTLCGTVMLGIGIALGAMWANVSWGRYWGWDPKETFALITMLVYAVPFHRFFQADRCRRRLSIWLIFGFLCILMTYVGVNYLPSLHSYA